MLTRRAMCVTMRQLVAALLLAGCGGSQDEPGPASPPPAGPGLPLLGQGTHLGAWPTYEALPADVAGALAARLAEARAAGMSIGRVHVSWADLEPNPGQFDLSDLQSQLAAATANGLALHVLIETLDSEGYALPPDLIDATDPYRLARGHLLNDPVILARFDALLDRVLPAFAGHRVFALSIANEPDNYFDDHPPTTPEGAAFRDALVGFLGVERARIRAAMPDVAVAMTLRQSALGKGFANALAPVVAAGDVVVFNYYCQDDNLQVKPAAAVAGDLDAIAAAAAGRPIVLQELGCPAGRTRSRLGASDAAQAAFFAAVFDEMASRPALRAAFVFQAVDWSPALARTFTDPLRQAGFRQLADRYDETLGTIGLIRLADGTTRPAWSELMKALGTLR